ncbi:MAG: Polysaccharide biosynthesis protein [Anaerolineae bacterium]|jgi:O-antigen/teichoic acid export membrane protein|nr:MAG: Polysaccharide biosynthesis protein [Anaerolineae bacterium]
MLSAFKDTIRGFLTFGTSSSLVSLIGFVLIPVYTRYLSVEDFGLLGLVNLTVSIAASIFGLGLNSAIFRSYFDCDDKSNQKKLVGTALLVASASTACLILLGTLCAEPLIAGWLFTLPGTGKYYQIAIYTGAISLLNAIPLAVYRAERQFGRFAAFNIIGALLQMILIIVLVIPLHLGLMGVVIGQLAATLVVNALLLYSIRNKVEVVLLRDEMRKLLAYGLPLVPGNVFYLFLISGSLYFIQITGDLAEAGVYNLALKIASVFSIFVITPFQLVWPPMMFSVEKTNYANRFYANMLIYALYYSVGIAIVLSVFANEIVAVVSTPAYASAAPLIGFVLFGHVLFVMQNVFNVGILLKRKTTLWSAALILETLVSAVMWLIFAPRWGLLGITMGSIIGYGFGVCLTFIFSQRFMRVAYEWKRVLFLILLFLLSIGISYIFPNSYGIFLIVLKSLLVILLLASPFLFKLWYPYEIAAMQRLYHHIAENLFSGFSPAENNGVR